MAEYIEREALTAELAKGTIITDYSYGMGIMAGVDFALKTARSIPAADVVEVKHGRWVDTGFENSTGTIYICSACNKTNNPNKKDVELGRTKEKPDYCPNCGCRMDGGADNAAD